MYYISLVAFVGVLKYSQSSMYRQSDDPMACHTTTRPIQMPHREEVCKNDICPRLQDGISCGRLTSTLCNA